MTTPLGESLWNHLNCRGMTFFVTYAALVLRMRKWSITIKRTICRKSLINSLQCNAYQEEALIVSQITYIKAFVRRALQITLQRPFSEGSPYVRDFNGVIWTSMVPSQHDISDGAISVYLSSIVQNGFRGGALNRLSVLGIVTNYLIQMTLSLVNTLSPLDTMLLVTGGVGVMLK